MSKYGYGNTAQNGGVSHKWTDKDAEIERTIGVITNRNDAGMDLTYQLAHYKNLTGQNYTFKPQTTQQPTASSGGGGYSDGASYVNSIYDNQRQAQLQALYASRDKAVGQLNQQKNENSATFQANRNQSDVVNAQNVQKLREMMAANGLNASGENVTANVGLQNARMNALNSLNLQEQQSANDINRQIADLNNPANEQSLIAAIEAQRAQALYGSYRDSIGDSQWHQQFNQSNNQWQQQFNQSNNQWQQQFNTSNNQWQQSFDQSNNQFNQNLAFQKEQFQSETAWRQYTFNNMSASEKAQLENNKMQFGEEMAWRLFELKSNNQTSLANNQALINFYKTGRV